MQEQQAWERAEALAQVQQTKQIQAKERGVLQQLESLEVQEQRQL